MSLFEDPQYRWRETYFVLFDSGQRPTIEAMVARGRISEDSAQPIAPELLIQFEELILSSSDCRLADLADYLPVGIQTPVAASFHK